MEMSCPKYCRFKNKQKEKRYEVIYYLKYYNQKAYRIIDLIHLVSTCVLICGLMLKVETT